MRLTALCSVCLLLLAACAAGDDLSEAEEVAEPAPAVPEPGPTPAAEPAAATTPSVQVQQLTMKDGDEDRRARWLGLSVANMKDPVPGAPPDRRGVVTRAFRGGPGDKAGLRRGDVLLRAGEREVLKYQDYLAEARNIEIGQSLELVVLRDGKELPVRLEMIEKPDDLRAWKVRHWPGSEAPGWDVEGLRGATGRVKAAGPRNKPVILYFWATWCGPCRQTSPMLDELYRELGPDKLELLAVSSEDRPVLDAYLVNSETSYPIVLDDKGDMKLDYEVKKLPTVVLIDEAGRVLVWDTSVSGVRRVVEQVRARYSG